MDDLTYWKKQLADTPELLALPIDRLRQAEYTPIKALNKTSTSLHHFLQH